MWIRGIRRVCNILWHRWLEIWEDCTIYVPACTAMHIGISTHGILWPRIVLNVECPSRLSHTNAGYLCTPSQTTHSASTRTSRRGATAISTGQPSSSAPPHQPPTCTPPRPSPS